MTAVNRISVPFSFSGAIIVAMMAMCLALWPQPALAEGEVISPTLTVLTTTLDLPSSAATIAVPVHFTTTAEAVSSVYFTLEYNKSCLRIANPATAFSGYPATFSHSELVNADSGEMEISLWKDGAQTALTTDVLMVTTFTLEPACLTGNPTTIFTFTTPTPIFGKTDGISSVTGAAQGGTYTLDLNQAPTAISSPKTTAENATGARSIATLSTTDVDGDSASTTFAMATACGDFSNDGFWLNPANTAQLYTDRTFNFEADASYTVCVQANDGQGATFTQEVDVNITDVDEAPYEITLSNAEVMDGETTVGAFGTEDEDTGDTFTYALVATGEGSADSGSFNLTPEGALSFKAPVNFAVKSVYKIRVESTGSDTLALQRQFTIVVYGQPSLALPGTESLPVVVVAGQSVAMPVNYTPNGNGIATAAFTVTYNTACFNYTGLSATQATFASVVDSATDGTVVVTLSSSSAVLEQGVIAAYTFAGVADCAIDNYETSISFGTGDAAPVLKLADGRVRTLSAPTNGRLAVIEDDARGDCNSDGAINAGDFSATALEILDDDDSGISWLHSPKDDFRGSPKGCDSNNDTVVAVSDIICTARTFFGLGCAAPVLAAAAATPVVTAPSAVPATPGMAVDVPVQLTANDNAISSMAFTLNFDASQFTFDPADNDGDGVADALSFNVPAAVYRMAVYDAAHGRLQVLLTGVSLPLPLLTDGAVVTVQLVGAAGGSTQPASLTLSDVSLGSESGQTVPVEVGSTDAWYGFKVFMPMAQ